MRHRTRTALLAQGAAAILALTLCAALLVAQEPATPAAGGARVMEVRIDDMIQPTRAEYVRLAIKDAESSGASLVLITLDTPGGLDTAMREIIQGIITSKVPVVAAVSCNPATFARDARILIRGGYKLTALTPVDQFLWSPHLELIGEFRR